MSNYKNFIKSITKQNFEYTFMRKIMSRKILVLIYISLFIFFLISIYFLSPKILNYMDREDIIKKSLLLNNKLYVKNINQINYKVFPSPRLILKGANLQYEDGSLLINEGTVSLVLNIREIYNLKKITYKKILITKSEIKINIDQIHNLLEKIRINKKKLIIKRSNFILMKKNSKLIEIKNAKLRIKINDNNYKIILKGLSFNEQIFINYTEKNDLKNFNLKIPSINSKVKVSFKNLKKENLSEGTVNFQLLNNYLQFNFLKDNLYKLERGFFRNKSFKSSFKGDIYTTPNIYLKLDFLLNKLNTSELFPLISQIYFSNPEKKLIFIKKINGEFNVKFSNNFKGNIVLENGNIFLRNFLIEKNDNSINFDMSIENYVKNKKIHFNLSKLENNEKIIIKGFLVPVSNKVVFNEIYLDEKMLQDELIKKYENNFSKNIIKNSLENIFSYPRIDKFLKSIQD